MSKAMGRFLLSTKGGDVYDDVSGEQLDPRLVKAARALEMEFFERLGVYTRAPRTEAFRSGVGKIIQGRWIDVNKGEFRPAGLQVTVCGQGVRHGGGGRGHSLPPPHHLKRSSC